jgi:hypothetical protein
MNTIITPLEEHRRDALVAYYLGQLATSANTTVPEQVTTAEDLYEYLLIDNQVSAQVETLRVFSSISTPFITAWSQASVSLLMSCNVANRCSSGRTL